MNTKKDIKREYKERKARAGIFQIKNTVNGKVLIGSRLNIDGILNRYKFQLSAGSHPNKELQKDFNELDPDKFTFEILDIIEEKDEPSFNLKEELELLEQIWLEKLEAHEDNSYNTDFNLRQA